MVGCVKRSSGFGGGMMRRMVGGVGRVKISIAGS